jgi:hypothetical protein
MANPPKWGDDDAVLAEWVSQYIPERCDGYLFPELIDLRPGVPWQSWDKRAMEREAFEAAQQGNFRMLGWMLDKGMSLKPQSLALIAARLMGKFKSKGGAARMSVARRRAKNPMHDVANEVPTIQKILQQHYPKQHGHRDRAISLAATRANMKRSQLVNYLKNSHKLNLDRT